MSISGLSDVKEGGICLLGFSMSIWIQFERSENGNGVDGSEIYGGLDRVGIT